MNPDNPLISYFNLAAAACFVAALFVPLDYLYAYLGRRFKPERYWPPAGVLGVVAGGMVRFGLCVSIAITVSTINNAAKTIDPDFRIWMHKWLIFGCCGMAYFLIVWGFSAYRLRSWRRAIAGHVCDNSALRQTTD